MSNEEKKSHQEHEFTPNGSSEDTSMELNTEEAREGLQEEVHLHEETAETVLKATDELAEQAREIETLKEEIKQLKDKLLRQAADFQNYRRRMEEELQKAAERGREDVLKSMLSIVDDLRRALEAADLAKAEGKMDKAFEELHRGVELVYQNFMKELARFGVEPIESVGEPFDETHHEAMMQQEAPEGVPSGTVIAEVQKGYKKGDQVLRHAKVIVSK